MKDIFKKMTAEHFFTNYVQVSNWRKKMSGRNSNGNPIDFTDKEKEQIKRAWKKYIKDLSVIQ